MDLRLVTLSVRDLDRMTAFYTDLLEREPAEVEPGRLVEYEFGDDDVLFGLYDPTADGDDEPIKYGTNCVPAFRVEAFDRQRDRLAERPGAEVVYEREAAGHHWLVFEDPEGNRVEIYEH